MDVAHVQNAGYQHLAHHLPLVQGGRALHGNANAIQHGPVLLLTAGDERTFFSRDVLAAHHQGVEAVDDPLDLGGDGVPVHRHGEHQGVCFQNGRGDEVEIIVKGAGLSGFEAGFTGVATAYFHHGGVKAGNGMALGLGGPDECVGHGEAVAVFAGAAGYHNDLFAHGGSSLWPGIDFSHALRYHSIKHGEKDKYAHESVILT